MYDQFNQKSFTSTPALKLSLSISYYYDVDKIVINGKIIIEYALSCMNLKFLME